MSSPPEPGHGKQPEASPGSGHGKEAEEAVFKTVKPEPAAEAGGEGDDAFINIKFTSQTAPDVFIRVKRNLPMKRIMDKYCDTHSLEPKAVLFLNEEGRHIRSVQTAEEAGLENGSSIEVLLRQEGGSGRSSV